MLCTKMPPNIKHSQQADGKKNTEGKLHFAYTSKNMTDNPTGEKLSEQNFEYTKFHKRRTPIMSLHNC